MLDLFGRRASVLQKKLDGMENHLKDAFSKIKNENDNTKAWLTYYYDKSKQLEGQLGKIHDFYTKVTHNMARERQFQHDQEKMVHDLNNNMAGVLSEISVLQQQTRQKVHNNELNFHIENISNSIKVVDSKVEKLSYLPSKVDALKEELEGHLKMPHVPTEVEKRLDEIQEKLKTLVIKKSPKEKLVQKVAKNSHDYIKAMILSYIRKYGKISGYQIREMVVEEQNITSKSTLYRILEEIEQSEEVSTIRQGKEKIFLSNLSKPV